MTSISPERAVTAVAGCTHCGQPMPGERVTDEARFCCRGCATAWSIIHAHGLDGYYAQAERRRVPARGRGSDYAAFDHESFLDQYGVARPDGQVELTLHLEGVHCASCVWLVEKMPLLLEGVSRAELDVTRALATVVFDPRTVRPSQVAQQLDALGYPPHPFRGRAQEELRRLEDRHALARIGVSAAIASNVMLLAIALYAGDAARAGVDPLLERFFRWLSFGLTVLAAAWPGRGFFRAAWQSLRARTLHVDLPIALALGAGLVRGGINTITDRGPIYFDGVAMLIFLLLVGRFFQQRAQRRAVDASELLQSLAPAVALVVDGETAREVPVEALVPGMMLRIRADETVAVDARVLSGVSAVNRSFLTGESVPVPVAPGDLVLAGSVNVGAPLMVSVEVTGEATRLGRLLAAVAAGTARRAPVVQYANQVGGAFIFIVLALAAVTWVIWQQRDPSRALDTAIAFLVVTCPCALALGTPLAITVALGRAAGRGILVKGGDALEMLAAPGTMLLDKTGTLTEGRMTVAVWEGDPAVQGAVAALEQEATHPIAEAFRRAWPQAARLRASAVQHVRGAGVRGMVDGREVVVGAPAFVSAEATVPAWATVPLADRGLTPVLVAVDGVVVARAGLGDRIRPDARQAIDAMRARGWQVRILSGDAPDVVRSVAAALGVPQVDAMGGVTPEGKLQAVESCLRSGRVVMVGDGVNDAAAMARASVGVAVRGGAEASLAVADAFFNRPGLTPLVELLDGSRRTFGVIQRCLVVSVFYNLIGAALAMTGTVSPLLAAILMPVSSISVVLTAWKSRTFPLPEPSA